MSYYLDASFVVTAFAPEVATKIAQDWLESHGDHELYISPWVLTEFSSALSMKVRIGALNLEQRADVMANWRIFSAASLGSVSIQSEDFETAARFTERHDLSLRASDALHIAVAHSAGFTLVTLDNRMAEASLVLGVPVAAF